jgi:hypothetical protein
MRNIELHLIAAICVRYAANNGMKILTLDKCNFIAQGSGLVVNVSIEHLYDQYNQGHTIDETLQNESNWDAETA